MHFVNLRAYALKALAENRVSTVEGDLLVAGAHQFRTLWTRDFCLAVAGLLAVDGHALVRRQIDVLLSFQRADGLLVRGLDVGSPQRRVVLNTAFRFLPQGLRTNDYEGKVLRPEYLGEHGTPAMDSNALVALAVCQYCRSVGNSELVESHREKLIRAIEFYRQFIQQGLAVQSGFSDWQDSARREGAGFYLNLLLYSVREELKHFAMEFPWLDDLGQKIIAHFFDAEAGVFKQNVEREQIPLEANLWAVEMGLPPLSSRQLYTNLKAHAIWQNVGIPVSPPYPARDISWTTRVVGLRHYHDGLRWSWLMAEAARVASKMGDRMEATRLLTELNFLVEKSDGVAEVYSPDGPAMFRTLLYRSEQPFTWGAAKILQALAEFNATNVSAQTR